MQISKLDEIGSTCGTFKIHSIGKKCELFDFKINFAANLLYRTGWMDRYAALRMKWCCLFEGQVRDGLIIGVTLCTSEELQDILRNGISLRSSGKDQGHHDDGEGNSLDGAATIHGPPRPGCGRQPLIQSPGCTGCGVFEKFLYLVFIRHVVHRLFPFE